MGSGAAQNIFKNSMSKLLQVKATKKLLVDFDSDFSKKWMKIVKLFFEIT